MNPLTLDIRTTIVLLFSGNLMISVLFFLFNRNSSYSRSLLLFSLAKLAQSIAWLLLLIRGNLPESLALPLSVVMGNIMLSAGFALESLVLSSFGGGIKKRWIILYTSIFTVFLAVFIPFASREPNLRVAAASFFSALYFIMPGVLFLFYRGKTLFSRFFGALYIILSSMLLIRTVTALVKPAYDLFTQSTVQSFSFLPVYMLTLCSVGFFMLIQEKTDQALMHAALTDALTGIPNRRYFFEHSEKVMAMMARRKETVTLLMLDLDDFKIINDSFGHQAGDEVLVDFAQVLKAQTRSYDIMCRYGGEEFAILLPGTDIPEAVIIADRIRAAIADTNRSRRPGLPSYTVSVGVSSTVPDQHTQMDNLIRESDICLYQAKAAGKNRTITCYDAEVRVH